MSFPTKVGAAGLFPSPQARTDFVMKKWREGATLTQIAAMIGVSRTRVHQMIARQLQWKRQRTWTPEGQYEQFQREKRTDEDE